MLFALVLLCGCSSVDLGDEWLPLEKIQQSRSMTIGLSDRGARTVGRTVYVRNIDTWLETHPEPAYSAVLHHERVHAWRQLQDNLLEWLATYLTDTDFQWYEEQLGWYVQLRWLVDHGARVIPEAVAKNLAGYGMVDEDEALAWVREVLSGSWHPPAEDLPPR